MLHERCTRGRSAIVILIASALGITLLSSAWLPASASRDAVEAATLPDSGPDTIYLPLMMQHYHPPLPTLGTHMDEISDANRLDLAGAAGLRWITFSGFDWDLIQPDPNGPYNWGTVDEESLANAQANGLTVIASIKFAPTWAQLEEGYYCGPIHPDALPAYAEFLTELVNRYSAPPYGVRYWQLGNEPDIDPELVPLPRSGFGCWGDDDDPYYGGGYYAEMLKVAYPAIKAADPNAQVVLGGLLLYCDPTAGVADGGYELPDYLGGSTALDCTPSLFMEGILLNGGGGYFDIANFHGYAPYDGSLQQDRFYLNWDDRGGVVLGKIDYLRELMATYGVDKPLIDTESALLCPGYRPDLCDPPVNDFYEAQAEFVVWMYVRNWAEGLPISVWFGWTGDWQHSSLLYENLEPKPAYHALDFLSEELYQMEYARSVTDYPDLLGYEFTRLDKAVWVLWPPDEQPYQITLPANTLAVYDKYGNDITPGDGTLTVEEPIYVELPPQG